MTELHELLRKCTLMDYDKEVYMEIDRRLKLLDTMVMQKQIDDIHNEAMKEVFEQ